MGRDSHTLLFRKSSPVPFFTLKEGAPPLPRPPPLRGGLQPLHAVPLVTPCGLQGTGAFISPRPITYATELRLFMRLWRPCGWKTAIAECLQMYVCGSAPSAHKHSQFYCVGNYEQPRRGESLFASTGPAGQALSPLS